MHEIRGYRPATALLGDSLVIRQVCAQLQRAALVEVPVLITGESGTGKELAARFLHDLSPRRDHNFLKVNCPAISQNIFEVEMFGHEPGVQARTMTPGKCDQARNGTLFLDEIGELDVTLQPKLLCALQDLRPAYLGAFDDRLFDARLIFATSRDLEADVVEGRFRSDLFYRINVLKIQMPSLRERSSDVPILMKHFVAMYSDRFGTTPDPLRSSFVKLLQSYHWPGNIRELENLAKRYVVLGGEDHILSSLREPRELPPLPVEGIDLTIPLRVQTKRAMLHLERDIILAVLQANKWNRRKAARSLDISYRTLLQKIKDVGLPMGISPDPSRPGGPFQIPRGVAEVRDLN